MAFCRACGAENEEGGSFCEGCGAALARGAPAPSPAASATASHVPRQRSKLVPLLGGAGVAAVVLFLLYRAGLLPGFGQDRLVSQLVKTPLPQASYQGWRVEFQPSLDEESTPEPGQVGNVMAHLGKSGGGIAGFTFSVFKTPAQAETSYRDASTYDQARFPTLTPERLEWLRQKVVTPPGLTASCLDGGTRTSCHALAGRTVVFIFMDGGSVADAVASATALVAHVEALGQ